MRLILTFSLMLLMVFSADAQDFPKMDSSPMDAAYYPSRIAFRNFSKNEEDKKASAAVRVLYSRPQKKGRNIFGELVKHGEVWRLGANEAAEIQFFKDVTIGETRVKAGRYTMYALLGPNEWEIYINTDLDVWGAYAYNPKHTLASIKVPTAKTAETVEAFSVMFKEVEGGTHLVMAWDDTQVEVPIMW